MKVEFELIVNVPKTDGNGTKTDGNTARGAFQKPLVCLRRRMRR